MASVLNNEMEFNGFCHVMAKSNWSSAYNYITDIFNNSVSYKDKCNKVIKASLLTVRGFLLYIPFVNRITQLALRILSPELSEEFIESPFCFGEEELKIRYSTEVLQLHFPQSSETPGSFNHQLNKEGEEMDSLQNLPREQQDFPYLINNDPNAFEGLLQNPRSASRELSEEEQLRLDNWAKEMNLDKDVGVAETTKIQNGLDELD